MTLEQYIHDYLVPPAYLLQVGVIEGKSKNDRKKTIIDIGVTNAQLLYIHENGSPLNHIPARPILDYTIKWVNESGLLKETVDKMMETYLETHDIEKCDKIIAKLCLKIQNFARKTIYDNTGNFAPNAPSTIKAKGDNHPLFDTGQMARSITCIYTRLTNK